MINPILQLTDSLMSDTLKTCTFRVMTADKLISILIAATLICTIRVTEINASTLATVNTAFHSGSVGKLRTIINGNRLKKAAEGISTKIKLNTVQSINNTSHSLIRHKPYKLKTAVTLSKDKECFLSSGFTDDAIHFPMT